MPEIIITNPAPIVVQVKGGKTTTISSPSGSATRLVELSDVNTANVIDGEVLTYVAANGDFEFLPQASASATDQFARDQANAAFNQANTANVTGQAAFDKANGAIYTAAQIRANLSNTAPVNYDSTTGIISHADSGVTATTYGNTTFVPTITVDAKGHITSITNTAIDLPPSTDEFARAQANAAYNKANTANVTGQAAFDKANGAIYTAAQIRANLSNTAPINYDPSTGIISHAGSGATASGYGDAATVAKVVVDSNGHVTSVTNTTIAIAASQITSGTLEVIRGGTGQTAITVNGSLLIGNTVSGGFDVNPITQGAGITITNDKGSITIAANVTSATDQYARDKANGAVQTAFATINVAGQSDVVADSNTDTLTLIAGSSMVITTDAANDTITFSSTASGSAGNSFTTINVAGQSDVVADSNNDTLTLVAGEGIVLTTDAPNDSIRIQSTAYGNNGDRVFYENDQNVTANYSITLGKSAMSTGPITLDPGVVVTIPGGSRWVIL